MMKITEELKKMGVIDKTPPKVKPQIYKVQMKTENKSPSIKIDKPASNIDNRYKRMEK
jgi:hypothetical protein